VGNYRVQSPVFSITYPVGAVFGLPSGTSTPNLADGYWLLFAPLSPGAHTIVSTGVGHSGFGGSVTWHLTIAPSSHTEHPRHLATMRGRLASRRAEDTAILADNAT
jgi:hypothetical protein